MRENKVNLFTGDLQKENMLKNNPMNDLNNRLKIGETRKRLIREEKIIMIMPKKDTSIEVKIQNFLKQLNIEFLTHQYISEIEHSYRCDIMIPVQKIILQKTIIECFGNYWHKYPLARLIDIQRCKELREAGWRVLVFWENEIKLMEIKDLSKCFENYFIEIK